MLRRLYQSKMITVPIWRDTREAGAENKEVSKLSTRVTTILSTEPWATSYWGVSCVSKTSPPSNSLLIRFTCVAVVGEFILGVEQTLVLHRRCLLFLEMTLLLRRCVSEKWWAGCKTWCKADFMSGFLGEKNQPLGQTKKRWECGLIIVLGLNLSNSQKGLRQPSTHCVGLICLLYLLFCFFSSIHENVNRSITGSWSSYETYSVFFLHWASPLKVQSTKKLF